MCVHVCRNTRARDLWLLGRSDLLVAQMGRPQTANETQRNMRRNRENSGGEERSKEGGQRRNISMIRAGKLRKKKS